MIKEFKTIEEMITDPIYVEELRQVMSIFISQRYSRPTPKPGYHYKKDIYDAFDRDGKMNVEYMIDQIPPIWNKQSTLPSIERQFIQYFCEKAVDNTMLVYQKMPEPEVTAKKVRKPRKTAKKPLQNENNGEPT